MKSTKPIKSEKVAAVNALTETIKTAKSVVFVDYTGMDMKTQQGLQNKLKENGARFLVAKNTLLQIAGKNANLPEESLSDTVLSGQTAMVVSDTDAVSPLQILGKYIAETEKPKWKVGIVEGSFQDAAGLTRISKLPGRDQMVAQVIGSVASPLYGLLATLNGNIQKLVYVLEARRASQNA